MVAELQAQQQAEQALRLKYPPDDFSHTSPYLRRRALRLSNRLRPPNIIADLELRIGGVSSADETITKRRKNSSHNRCARSHSITAQPGSEIARIAKRCREHSAHSDLLLDPNQLIDDPSQIHIQDPGSGSTPSGGKTGGTLPRTLSTSVLRIKHRRTFWERMTR